MPACAASSRMENSAATQTLLERVSTLLDQASVIQGAFAHVPSGEHMLQFSATTRKFGRPPKSDRDRGAAALAAGVPTRHQIARILSLSEQQLCMVLIRSLGVRFGWGTVAVMLTSERPLSACCRPSTSDSV